MSQPVAGVLLAGGRSRRMGGGDKAWRALAGRPLIAHVIERLRPQVAALLINVNGDPAPYREFGAPVLGDLIAGFAGPLAGILTGLDWAARELGPDGWIVTAPTDSPFLPRDLVAGLLAARERAEADLAVAMSGGRSHPVVGLWPVRLLEPLRAALVVRDERKIDHFTADYAVAEAAWACQPCDPFFNANRPDDLADAERLLASGLA